MGIGQFAQTGLVGTFSAEELQFLDALQERGFDGLDQVYPELAERFAQQNEAGDVNTAISETTTVGDFITQLTTDIREPAALLDQGVADPRALGSSFPEQALRLPGKLASRIYILVKSNRVCGAI